MNKRKERKEIAELYKWDLEKIYKTIKEWEEDFEKVPGLLKDLLKYKGKVMDSSHNLFVVLTKLDELDRLLENIYIYAYMKYHEDTTDNKSLIAKGKIDKLVIMVNEEISSFSPEILKCDYALVEKYIAELDDLKLYAFDLECMFRQKEHTLNDNEELILASVGEVLNSSKDIYDTITDSDLTFGKVTIDNEEIEITASNFVNLLRNGNQEVRKTVFETFFKTYDNFKNTFGATLKHKVKSISFVSKTRKYENPLQKSLYGNNIPVAVYDNLIKTVNNNLNIMHKYINLRKKELKLDELHMYDIYVSMVPENKKIYEYEEALTLVKEALKPLGEDYLKVFEQGIKERWIDVYPNIGKRGGAYSWGTYDSNPYILLNFDGSLNNVSTIAHELGHSMHSYLTNKKQPHIYAGHAIFTAEVASNVNEILLCRHLLKEATNKEQKKIIINELLDGIKGSIYRQTMFAEFEKTIFEKEMANEVLTEELMSKIYYDLNKKYYGEEIVHDDYIRYEWMRVPHFYSPFYVYQYATGLAAAYVIAENILTGKEDALANYLNFLAAGDSDYPIELLKATGVDMTSTESIEQALKIFDKLIDDYNELDK